MTLLLLLPAAASAEPLCTDNWTGPAEGNWTTAADWSAGVPASTTVACVGAGKVVTISEGSHQVGVLEDKGSLGLAAGSLEITNALEPSTIASLGEANATLSGAATVDISSSLVTYSGSLMTGSGSTVILPGASGTLVDVPEVGFNYNELGSGRTFVNEGTVSLNANTLAVNAGATFDNKGTFTANTKGDIEGSGTFINAGTLQRTENSSYMSVYAVFENKGTVTTASGSINFFGGGSSSSGSKWHAASGQELQFNAGNFSFAGGTWEGAINIGGADVTAEGVTAANSVIGLTSGKLIIPSGTMTVAGYGQNNAELAGSGTLAVSEALVTYGSAVWAGSGKTVILPGATATLVDVPSGGFHYLALSSGRTLVNEGIATLLVGVLALEEGARFVNTGTVTINAESYGVDGSSASFVNIGTLKKTEGAGTTIIQPPFENYGDIREETGRFEFEHPVISRGSSTQYGGAENPSTPGEPHPTCGDPVSCASGNYTETETDFTIGGRGVGLDLLRTYNSQAAAEGVKGAFGYGWTSSFSGHLVVNKTSKVTTLSQANGSTVPFTEEGSGTFKAPVWTQDILSGTEGSGYTLTLASQIKYKFAGSSGRLESVTDRDGNSTTLTYNGSGQLTTITDPVSRTIKLTYNGEGLVESAEDPMKHVVKYTYEGGNLRSVTQPAEAGLRWQFKYDGSHRMTEMVDGRGGKTINEYSGSNQVAKQEDPAGHKLKFEYETFQTKITNENTGSVTDERFTSSEEPWSITHGYGTASATAESYTYNEGGYVTSVTDGSGHTTTYGYDTADDRTSTVDPNKNETKWTYDSTHDVETMTTPKGEVTTIKREAHGNPETISRPAPGSTTQTTKYAYGAHGELESVEDPLKRVWKYEYDGYGDRKAEIDSEGNKRTWEYNEDSLETAMVSPRGNITGGKPAEFTTAISRDAQGRPLKVSEPEPSAGGKPVSRTAVTISGAIQEGQTLIVATGIWEGAPTISYTYQWQHCNSSGSSCANVSGATGAAYLLGHGDVGYTLKVVVTATNSAGSASSTSEATAVATAATGSWLGVVGNSAGAWDGVGKLGDFPAHNVLFDAGGWHNDGEGIAFEAGELPGSGDDLSRSIGAGMVPVVAIDYHGQLAHGWGSDSNFPHTTEQINTYAKGFVETAKAIREDYPGKTILFEVMDAPWSNTTPEYNGAEYAPVVAKVLSEATAASIPLSVVYVGAQGPDQNSKEELTAGWVPSIYEAKPSLESEVQGWSLQPFGPAKGIEAHNKGGIEAVPVIREQMHSGQNNIIVSAVGFCADDVEGGGCGTGPEAKAHSSEAAEALTTVLQTARGYHEAGWLKALLVFTRHNGGWSMQLESGALTKQGEALETFANTYMPRIPEVTAISPNSGTAGGATTVTITGAGFISGSTVKFGSTAATGVTINSETSITATSPSGTGIVDVTVTNTHGTSPTNTYSEFTYGPSNTKPPAVSGELLVGQTLRASTGTWTAVTSPTYTYQWQHCNSSGGSCTNISGATSSTRVLVSGDVGYTLRVIVKASNLAGSAESSSTATDLLTEVTAQSRTTEYSYDGDGNVESITDANGHKTKYTYNADNEPIKVEAPNKAVTETEYDGTGQVIKQIDGSKHATEYKRNVLEEVTEVVNPLGHKTTKEYDLAGNLTKLTDPAKRTTTYTYDPGNRLTEVVYSSGSPATVKYEYDKDGDRLKMTDGTGTSKYTYDQLDRLTEAETGHKEVSKYEYDLANEQTKITYPNTKAVTRAFDKDGRLEKVTDWNGKETKFSYDPDSDLKATLFPSESKDEDTYAYNDADQMSEVKMLKGTETLASLVYTRDNDGQATGATSKGLPGEEKPAYEYDANNRLTKGATVAYEYDAANNPTKIGTGAYKYNSADQLETGPSLAYTYDELGERTKTKPTTGPATTYGYDQAGELTSVERPKEGATAEIKDTYAYDGNGLRASQTISGTTTYMVWDVTEGLPLILSDTTNYIYGPGGLPVEQVSSGGTVTYLYHDQQGSTRLLTGSTGTVTGSTTFDAYGNKTGSTGTSTTPLGYDGQYTSSDTGLIYLRARVYDPATAEFLTVDPLVGETGAPYNYSEDNPLNLLDPSGLSGCGSIAIISTVCNWGQESGISEAAAGALNYLTFGASTDVAGDVFGFNPDCASFGSAGTALGAVIGAFDGEDEAEIGAEGASIAEDAAGHIFRDRAGHLAEDTPENRALLEGVVNPANYVLTKYPAVAVYRETLSNGTQVWAEVKDGVITNGGLNQTPR